jgi:AcrR family transcriptional regulator
VSAPPKRLTRAEKQAQTRQALLDAAEHVFRQRGFQGASVDAITAEAGFSRGAFYSNFESKEQLFVELLQQRAYEEYRGLLERMPQDVSALERLRWSARELMERYERERHAGSWQFELWLEVLAHAARHPEFRALAASFWTGTRTVLAQQVEGDYRQAGEEPQLEPKHIAIALTALDIGLAVQHLVDPDEVPLSLYPELYEALFAPIVPSGRAR